MTNVSRSTRFDGRAALHRITTDSRCFDCGRQTTGTAVSIRLSDGVAGFAGLVSCGRVWLCPVCNAKVMARRAVEIGAALTWAQVEGYQVIFGSLTCRHDARSDLGELLDVQRRAWRHVMNSKDWRAYSATREVPHTHAGCPDFCELVHAHVGCSDDCERKRDTILLPGPGRVGYIRASEITIGMHGWHPHFHPLIIVRGTVEYAQGMADAMTRLWVDGVHAAGGSAQLAGSQHLRVISGAGVYDALSGYVTKATYDASRLSMEAVWSQGKTGRGRVKETVSHWSLLASVAEGLASSTGELTTEGFRWVELEDASSGHRMISWSRGLRAFAGLSAEKDDAEVASQELGSKDDDVCFITPEGWAGIRDRPEVLALLLDVLEVGGWAMLRPVLDGHGIDYFVLEAADA